MKIIVNDYIPFKGYKYINLFGLVFTRSIKNVNFTKEDENHENIHSFQMKWLLYILFYILYITEWICKIPVAVFCDRGKYSIIRYAYRSISVEQVAYYNQDNLNYLETANPYEWVKYIFKMYKV